MTALRNLECYTVSRVDKHPKIWYNIKKQKEGKKNGDLQ